MTMTTITTSDYDPRSLFVTRLEKLTPAARAKFKRNSGKRLSEAGGALGLFYQHLPRGVSQRDEEAYFLIATLFPMADAAKSGEFGGALRRARVASGAKGMDRRVEILLDADSNQLPHRLRQAIQYLKANEVRVNWLGLLNDVLLWGHPKRIVQQRWARAYFAEAQSESATLTRQAQA